MIPLNSTSQRVLTLFTEQRARTENMIRSGRLTVKCVHSRCYVVAKQTGLPFVSYNEATELHAAVLRLFPDIAAEHAAPKRPTTPKEEPIMAAPKIITITYINSTDIRNVSDDELIEYIHLCENEATTLMKIETDSVKIKAKITALDETCKFLRDTLDAR